MRTLISLLLLTAVSVFQPVAAQTGEGAAWPVAGSVPLYVDWGKSDVAVSPVTFGVPLPNGLTSTVENLRVVNGEGKPVPAQMAATATWQGPDGPIRWLLLSMNVEQGQTYALEYGSNVRAYDFANYQGIQLKEDRDAITVNTGAMQAVISKVRPTVLDAVYIDADGNGRFTGDEAIVTPDAAAANLPVVTDGRGNRYVASDSGLKVSIARSGPMEVAIRREGWYVGANGTRFAQFVTYTYFYADQAAVRHDHTFIVAFDSTENQVRDIRLSIPVAMDTSAKAEFATSTAVNGDIVTVDANRFPVYLVQNEHNHWVLGGSADSGEVIIASGDRSGGWFGLSDQRWGIYAGYRDFWQQFPGELEIDKGVMHIHLWSSRGGNVLDFTPSVIMGDQYPGDRIFDSNYYVGGLDSWTQAYGIGKTHNIWLNFYTQKKAGGSADGDKAEAAKLTYSWLHEPVLVMASPEWNVSTQAFGIVHPEDRERFPELEAALDALLHRKYWMQEHFAQYGWIDYGDAYYRRTSDVTVWRRWASMFYGWPNVAPLLYLRSGRRDAWNYHRINTKHIIDIDIGHLDSTQFGKRRGGRYGGNGGIVHYAANQYTHGPDTRIRFMYFDYYINGNLRAWEVADYYAQDQYEEMYPNSQVLRSYQGRTSGGTLRLFSEAYEATWKPEYLRAMRDVAETFYRELAERGFTEYDDVYKNEGKLKYYQLTGDKRMLDLFLNDMQVLLESRDPLSGRLPRPDGRGNTMWSLANVYLMTGNEDYARYMYWQVGNALSQMQTALDPHVGPESIGDMIAEFTGPPEQTYHATMGVQFPTAMVVMAQAMERTGYPFVYLLADGYAYLMSEGKIIKAEDGDGLVLCGSKVTIPALGRPLRVYFYVPAESQGAALVVSAGVRIYTPEGTPLNDGKVMEGWIDIPSGQSGLWSMEAANLYGTFSVEARNLPPVYALDDPARYFMPDVAWLMWKTPAPDSEVMGVVPVTFAVRIPEGAQTTPVRVFVDDQLYWEGEVTAIGDEVTAEASLMLDTLKMADGRHELMVMASSGEFVQQMRTALTVRNTWTLYDPLIVVEFFGTLVDNTMITESSGGWRYLNTPIPDGPEDTFRMVRLADTEEYLVWDMPELGVNQYEVVLFVHGNAVNSVRSAVELAFRDVSGSQWRPVGYQVMSESPTPSGWCKVVLSGEMEPIVTPVQFRVVFKQGVIPADQLQIGDVTFVGMRQKQ